MLRVSWIRWASWSEAEATQAVAGNLAASSSAIVGPDNAAKPDEESEPRTSAMIWVGRNRVLFSIPFATEQTGTPLGVCFFRRVQMLRINWHGTAEIIRSAPIMIFLSSGSKIIVSGSLWPGRNFRFSRL